MVFGSCELNRRPLLPRDPTFACCLSGLPVSCSTVYATTKQQRTEHVDGRCTQQQEERGLKRRDSDVEIQRVYTHSWKSATSLHSQLEVRMWQRRLP